MKRLQILTGLSSFRANMDVLIHGIFLVVTTVVLLAGCGGAQSTGAAPTGEVPVVADTSDGKVVAEAVIEPARWSELRFDAAGHIAKVLVQEGDAVAQGDVLARLEQADLERAVAQDELALQQAQLHLEQLQEPAREADVEAARAALSDAQVAYQQAKANQTLTEHSVSVGDDVRATRYARDETYRAYQHQVDKVGANSDDPKLAAFHNAYLNALGAYNRAVENADLQVANAKNEVTRAYHAIQEAQNALDALLEGADEQDVEAANLEVETAELNLDAARSNLEQAVLVAPFAGIVTAANVEPGDAAASGEVAFVLATLDQLQARVAEGQAVVVTVDALPDLKLPGRVVRIGLQSVDYRGDVTYPVYVALDEPAPELRWGMTALVEIEAE